jgi:glycosyltransferase involved in cell wall biosynthesis
VRVLMLQRNDASQVPGGDSLRFGHMQRVLADLGLIVDRCSEDSLPEGTSYDLVHLSNLQTEQETWRALQWASRRSLPTVLSPIYWDMKDAHFELGATKACWKKIRQRLGRRAGLRLYRLWQDLNRPRQADWRIRRGLLKQAVWLLPTSFTELLHLRRYFWLPENLCLRSTVVYSGVDGKRFSQVRRPGGVVYDRLGIRDYVLQVARISPIKNQKGLIEALWGLPIPIVLIGQESPYHPGYAAECRQLAARRENVFFLGQLPQTELPDVYATAAVHVLPSWRETPGLSSLEAAAAGCRVVSTSIGCAREYFSEDAWYCRPTDVASIRVAVESALQTEHSEHLRKRILRDRTWGHAAERTKEGYLRAMTLFESHHA